MKIITVQLIIKNNGKKIIALMSLVLATAMKDNSKLMMLLIQYFSNLKLLWKMLQRHTSNFLNT
jgi:hypothetical protein